MDRSVGKEKKMHIKYLYQRLLTFAKGEQIASIVTTEAYLGGGFQKPWFAVGATIDHQE